MKPNQIKEFIYPMRVHFEDTDCMGIVYHSNYLNYMERARSEWAEELGVGVSWMRGQGSYLAIHSVDIKFMKPAKLHELVEVVSSIKAIRPASIIFDQYLRSADSRDKIFCKAEIKVASVDEEMRPQELPKNSLSIWRQFT